MVGNDKKLLRSETRRTPMASRVGAKGGAGRGRPATTEARKTPMASKGEGKQGRDDRLRSEIRRTPMALEITSTGG